MTDAYFVAAMAGIYLLLISGPLVPAILIYWLFPDTVVVVKGPLSGLTMRATGAFAVYAVVFMISYPFASRMQETTSALVTPVWTLKARVAPVDGQGQRLAGDLLLKGMTVEFNPALHRISPPYIQLAIPSDRKNWPLITFQIPNHGGKVINLADMEKELDINDSEKVIRLKTDLEIPQFINTGFGLGGRPNVQ